MADPYDNARRARELRASLQAQVDELREPLHRHPQFEAAAELLCHEARALHEEEVRRPADTWIRPIKEVERFFKLSRLIQRRRRPRYRTRTRLLPKAARVLEKNGQRFARWHGSSGPVEAPVFEGSDGRFRVRITRAAPLSPAEEKELGDAELEWERLRRKLWLDNAFGTPQHHRVRRIACAAARGDDVELSEKQPWDPDRFMQMVVRRHLQEAPHLLRGEVQTRVRLGVCFLLAADETRTELELVLAAGGEKRTGIAGVTERMSGYGPTGLAPLRWNLASLGEWSEDSDNSDLRQRFNRLAEAGNAPAAEDAAEVLTADELSRLDKILLPIAEGLRESFGISTSSVLPPRTQRPEHKRKGRRQAYDPGQDERLIKNWKASRQTKEVFERDSGRDSGAVRKAQDRLKARRQRGSQDPGD